MVAAPGAAAQTRLSTELFVARNGALAPGSSMYGLGLAVSGGLVGLRASGSAAFASRPTATGDNIGVDAWTGEADLLLQPAIVGGGRAAVAFAPYAFGGVGKVSRTEVDGFRQLWTGASYGAGAAFPLGRALSVTAEARYRLPLVEAINDNGGAYDSSFPRGWEYRFGLAISLGG